MQSLEILKQELITQKQLLDEKGFPVDVKNVNPSPSEITKAIENINLDFSQSDAVESDVVAGKTFYSKNTELKTGTLELPDFESATATENTVMAGKTFYAGNTELKTGTAVIPDLSETTATESDVREGKEFFNASGEKVTGTYKDMLQQRIDISNSAAYSFYSYEGTSMPNLNDLDLSGVTSMDNMFGLNKHLTSIDVSKFNTSNVSNMGSVFYYCQNIETIDLSHWDTSKATTMYRLFRYCNKLKTVYGSLNMPNVTNVSQMFDYCTELRDITLKNIKIALMLAESGGTKLSLNSLLNTIKELWNNTDNALGGTRKLTIGTTNTAKLADVYVKLIDITDEMRAEDEYIDNKAPFEVCESTDEGAMLITEYVTTVKNWKLA